MEFLVVGVVILVGRELVRDMQSSLISVSSSVASYRSSNPDICRCHSVSEQEERELADRGEGARSTLAGRPVVFSFNCGDKEAACEGALFPSGFSAYCDSRISSIIVLSTVPRACRRGGHLVVGGQKDSVISARGPFDGLFDYNAEIAPNIVNLE